MKRKGIIFFLLIGLLIVGCSKTPDNEDKALLEGQYGIEEAIELNKADLEDKLATEIDGEVIPGDDFILYVYLKTCSSCQIFYRDYLQPYIKENQVVVYKTLDTVANQFIDFKKPHKTAPQLIIFKDGEILVQESKGHNKDVFSSKEGLAEFLDKYTILPTLLKVDSTQLDVLLANDEKKIIYYGWSKCGDCSYLEENYLKDYLRSTSGKAKWYIFDVDEYRQYKTPTGDGENEAIWNDFATKTHLDIKGNRGKVPTIIYYDGHSYVDAAIYFNDNLDYNPETGVYTVTGSYYENAEIIGGTYNSYDDYQKETEDFHNRMFKSFMDRYYENL